MKRARHLLVVLGLVGGCIAVADRARAATPSPPRRLEDIQIEGEVPVPQVLFITTREQRRFMDFQHRRYLRTSRQLGAATAIPAGVIVIRTELPAAGKEQQP